MLLRLSAIACPFVLAAVLANVTSQVALGGDPARSPMSLTVGDWAQIRELRENHRHALELTAFGHGARNPGLGMAAEFDGRSALIEPSGGEWQFGLAVRSYGFEGSMMTLSVPAFGTCVEGSEVTYGWSESLEEWWINDSRGFEHGFTVSERPACWTDSTHGSSPLRFRLDVLGTLRPAVSDGDSGLVALDASGHPVLRYEGLFAFDANGAILDAWLELEAGCLSICVEESKACYPITVDPVVQQAYLKASNTEDGDLFGRVVAISGDTVVVGADNEESSATGVNGNAANNAAPFAGAAYVFAGVGPPDIGFPVCTGVPNSTGASSILSLLGSNVAADNNLSLEVVGLPSMVAGYFLTSSGANMVNNPGGSVGTLCISSADIGRYAGNVLSSGSAGAVSQLLDLSSVPSATGSVQVLAGETRYFQFWHRDALVIGIPTSNFSGARGVAFQ